MKFQKVKFILSVASVKALPTFKTSRGDLLPEVAIVGRSNVGKSTLINHLFKKKIAKTSSTPGKTQLINFFKVDEELIFVDLPGYGYAKVPHKLRKGWGSLIEQYLENRPHLKLLLFLLDIRHQPSREDLEMLAWIRYHDIPTIIVFTKSDKLPPSKVVGQAKKILKSIDCENIQSANYSDKNQLGRSTLLHLLKDQLQNEE